MADRQLAGISLVRHAKYPVIGPAAWRPCLAPKQTRITHHECWLLMTTSIHPSIAGWLSVTVTPYTLGSTRD